MTIMTAPAFTYRHFGLRSGRFPAEDAVLISDDWMVFADNSLNRWEVFVDGVNKRTFVNGDLWESLDGPGMVQFEDDFVDAYSERKVREMRFIVTDSGPYGAAARREAENKGTSAVRAKDRLTDLGERADGLVIQAAGLNQAPTEAQLQIFAMRHAQLTEDMQALEADMDRLRAKISLAAVALVDAATP